MDLLIADLTSFALEDALSALPAGKVVHPGQAGRPRRRSRDSDLTLAYQNSVCAICVTLHSSLVENNINNISTDSIQLSETLARFEPAFSTRQLEPGDLVWLAGVRVKPLQRSHGENRHMIKCLKTANQKYATVNHALERQKTGERHQLLFFLSTPPFSVAGGVEELFHAMGF